MIYCRWNLFYFHSSHPSTAWQGSRASDSQSAACLRPEYPPYNLDPNQIDILEEQTYCIVDCKKLSRIWIQKATHRQKYYSVKNFQYMFNKCINTEQLINLVFLDYRFVLVMEIKFENTGIHILSEMMIIQHW